MLLKCQPDASLDLLEYLKQSSGVPSVYNYTEASLLKRFFGYSDHWENGTNVKQKHTLSKPKLRFLNFVYFLSC